MKTDGVAIQAEQSLFRASSFIIPTCSCKLSAVATSDETTSKAERFRPSSSIAGDVWHGEATVPAYEWWYFDALSDDGRDALVIIFLSNFIFSPHYNRAAMESLRQPLQANSAAQFPALAVCFYRDGRPLFRAINEYGADGFLSSTTHPQCRIGHNTFRLIETGSVPLYELHIETTLRGQRCLQARLEWTMKEGNFFEEEKQAATTNPAVHHWNMVAPRCDVSGEVALMERNGKRSFAHDFKGTGYHDHNRDQRWMPATIAEWQWGRIHFPSATAVFYHYRERNESQPITRLYLIQNNSLSILTPRLTTTATRQHLFGLRYPQRLQLQATETGDGPTLRVRQARVIDSSFFYLRFLSEATLETTDGRVQHASGITEHLAPRALSYPWLHWLINMRIGSNGRGAFLP
jgi:carotenoid 1,2-hydratase